MDKKWLDQVISKYSSPSGRILGILGEIQKAKKYLPKEDLVYVSKKIGIPISQIYSLATFYSFFELQPIGEHIITVCTGTACHVKGAPKIISALETLLGVEEGKTSPDGKFSLTTEDRCFTLNTARCFGACSMAPVLRIDGNIYGYNTPAKLPNILKSYGWRKK
ncbi:MAG: NAD(P)H-dependent oxidoreductase subunit E [Caldiserica bacterium]|nr:NAD(P)H-dependent oxidoreductase subunit E [Caldisericota bacterium]